MVLLLPFCRVYRAFRAAGCETMSIKLLKHANRRQEMFRKLRGWCTTLADVFVLCVAGGGWGCVPFRKSHTGAFYICNGGVSTLRTIGN